MKKNHNENISRECHNQRSQVSPDTKMKNRKTWNRKIWTHRDCQQSEQLPLSQLGWLLGLIEQNQHKKSRRTTRPRKWHVRPGKASESSLSTWRIHGSLAIHCAHSEDSFCWFCHFVGTRPVWSESSLCAQRVVKDPSILHADSEDSDQTGRMPRLIWVFAGCTSRFVGFGMRRLKYRRITVHKFLAEDPEIEYLFYGAPSSCETRLLFCNDLFCLWLESV